MSSPNSQKMYKEAVLDHYRNPRNYGELKDADIYVREDNPLCGDEVALYFVIDDAQVVQDVRFNGRGCAISLASASMLTEAVKGKPLAELKEMGEKHILDNLGIDISPMRLKCALLSLEVLQQGLLQFETGSGPRVQELAAQQPAPAAQARSSLVDQVGNTPLIRLTSRAWNIKPTVEVWAKVESFNPGGTVKARSALWMIRNAIKSNQAPLTPGMTLLDASSGCGGAAVALLGASMGFATKLIVPASTSEGAKNLMRAYGAQLMVLLDASQSLDDAHQVARATFKKDPARFSFLDSLNNPAAWNAHYATTGPEILSQSEGRITHLVAGVGSGATLVGTARRLKEHDESIEVYGVGPAEGSPPIEGLRDLTAGERPGIYDDALVDGYLQVSAQDAEQRTKQLAKHEGLLVGTSSGAALVASLQLAQQLDKGVIVTVLPDSGASYLDAHYWLSDY